MKIDPKSIGVGQYQHDMNQKKLGEALTGVVEDSVNKVGVDLNTASASLLEYISGISKAIAKNIVAYREENGRFQSRKELMKVSKLGPKAFEQCAGFLRITGGNLDSVDGIIDRERKTAYEATIKYPVTAAAITVEMNLQAQEARNIARPGLFYRDREALAAAANSLRAYDRLKELNARMGNRRPTPMPKLPGKLTDKQVKQYATDEQPELQPLPAQLGSTVALNAAAYSSASAGTARQPMTGHSMNAVRLPRGGVVRYTFMAKEDNPAVVRVATIPRSGTNYQVSIDGTQTQTAYTRIATADLLRGQTVVSFNFRVPKGLHTLEIKALSDGVTVDQWMFDFDINRQFYMFPVTDY